MRPSSLLSAVIALTIASPAFAQFSPGPNPITGAETTQRTLSSGTGTINSGGSITLTGSTVALLMSGPSTLVNNGTIQQTGSGRAIDNTGGSSNNSSLTVTNTGLISSNSADAFRVNTANTAVVLNNSGTVRVTNGGQAIDWAAITTASNTLNNLLGGVISAVGEDAIRPGQNGIVNNAGTISATPIADPSDDSGLTGSDGIDLRTQKNVTVTNSGTITGRHGIATDGANVGPSSLTVTNNAGGLIQALNGSGLNVDANTTDPLLPSALFVTANVTNAFGATIKGGVMATALTADGDGIDVDGVLTLNNSGDVLGVGAKGGTSNAEGIAAGGGSITNTATGRIIGSNLLGDTSRAGNGILIDDSNGGNAVAATTIANSGLIQGVAGFGIRMIGTFADTITNNAGGTIRGAGTGATIQTGDGGDTVTNRGAIVSDIGNAIDLEGGNDLLVVEGGTASITGNVSGGTGVNTATMNLGTGNSFAYAGVLSNFNTVEVQSGQVTLSGVNTYTGSTIISGGTLTLDGANRIASSSELVLNSGELRLENIGSADGQTFASLALTGSSTIDLNTTSSLTFGDLGAVANGATLSVLNFYAATSPEYAFRFVGDYSGNADFLALIDVTTINGLAAAFNFDGSYTNVAPVPTPAGWVLMLSGLGLLGTILRRRPQIGGSFPLPA